MRPRLNTDLAVLLDAKKRLEDPNATELKAWDIRYFENQVKKVDYALDEETVRDYLPKDTVMAGLFEIYSTLLGVNFEEVKDGHVWGPEVKLYAIRDRETHFVIGYFYTDFVPREGKYGHAAAFPLLLGRATSAGNYSTPVSAIVANFTPPANCRPSLLTHSELDTVFHEFGHIMHQTLTHAPYGFLSGSAVAQDFVEAPSQMLENWVWDPSILKRVSGHYSDSKQKMPDDMIAKIVASRDFNRGYFYSRQLSLGLTDMALHTAQGPVDVTQTCQRIHKDVMGFDAVAGSHFCAGFGHLMGGYDAGYYGYLWSEVFAVDMFTAFEKDGLLSSKTGGRYRDTILEQGNMLDAVDLLTEFLGRAPNNSAFLKKLRISGS
jgi:thimet oligopeptidase